MQPPRQCFDPTPMESLKLFLTFEEKHRAQSFREPRTTIGKQIFAVSLSLILTVHS